MSNSKGTARTEWNRLPLAGRYKFLEHLVGQTEQTLLDLLIAIKGLTESEAFVEIGWSKIDELKKAERRGLKLLGIRPDQAHPKKPMLRVVK